MRIARLVSCILLASLLTACENTVDLLTPPQEGGALPVVFGLINSSKDIQYISLSRTFRFSDGGSAFSSAANPDSLFYPAEDVRATIANMRTGTSTTLERVDLATSDRPRNAGVFPVSPNVVYRFKLSDIEGEPGDRLDLTVNRSDQSVATANVTLLSQLEFIASRPAPPQYNLIGKSLFSFGWRNLQNGAPFTTYELGFEFNFEETGPDGTNDRTLYFAPGQDLSASTNSVSLMLNGFLPFLASRLTADPAITRRFSDIRLVITGGDENFGAYQDLLSANSGITATQQLPVFTNIDGGLGLLGSVTQLRQADEATLSNGTFDSLRLSRTTRDLNFQ